MLAGLCTERRGLRAPPGTPRSGRQAISRDAHGMPQASPYPPWPEHISPQTAS